MMRSFKQRYYFIAMMVMAMSKNTGSFSCDGYMSMVRYHNNRHMMTTTPCHDVPTTSHIPSLHRVDTSRSVSVFSDETSSITSTKPTPPFGTSSWNETQQPSLILKSICAAVVLVLASFTFSSFPADAAPPFAVIAEELGYYPIMVPSSSSSGQSTTTTIQYVPKRVQRPSTPQAIDLAHYMRTVPNQQIVLAGTYWCSHTSHQKELFGVEAWKELNVKTETAAKTFGRGPNKSRSGFTYIECAPQGYRSNPTICSNLKIDGYPTWIITKGDAANDSSKSNTVRLSGERSLYDIANAVGYTDTFDASIEDATNPPSGVGPSACR